VNLPNLGRRRLKKLRVRRPIEFIASWGGYAQTRSGWNFAMSSAIRAAADSGVGCRIME
jgi:hypothetical protein